jgi:hypothetical protein
MLRTLKLALAAGLIGLCGPFLQSQDPAQKQIEAIKGVLPKFAIPMREVGDRFQNMYFAANAATGASPSICPSTWTRP